MPHCFSIADVTFALPHGAGGVYSNGFAHFTAEETDAAYTAVFRKVDVLPDVPAQLLYQSLEYAVYRGETGEVYRLFLDQVNGGRPYAIMRQDLLNRRVLVEYLPESEKYFSETGNCFFHIGWEKIMAHEDRMILHASCVDTPLGGILFSGPSGIGKSTQADLWCRLEGAKLLNGDRPILGKAGETWLAYGSPYAGSSRCYVQANCPVRAIVMLHKAPQCAIHRLMPGEAFRKLYAGMTVYTWDNEFVSRICDLTTDLALSVPVYELSCTPDQQAVELLKAELLRGGAI